MRYQGKKGVAWEAVKIYVRKKEKHCYTCGALYLEGANAQAGHYLPVGEVGSNNRLSWDERQIHLQCSKCNGQGEGQRQAYRAHLVADYGEEAVKEIEARRWRVDPVKSWQGIIDHFSLLTNMLKS